MVFVPGIRDSLDKHEEIFVIEEHSPYGGLGPRLKETAWDCQARCRLGSFSLKDEFIHFYGSHDELRVLHGL